MVADEHLRRSGTPLEVIQQIALPVNVLSAFACELFLKSLLVLQGQAPPVSHNLWSLFKRLHNKKKDRLTVLWTAAVAEKSPAFYSQIASITVANFPLDLRGALITAFDIIRYHYEDSSKSRFYLTDFPRILHGYILELKPDWE
jgi:hypothetical protein